MDILIGNQTILRLIWIGNSGVKVEKCCSKIVSSFVSKCHQKWFLSPTTTSSLTPFLRKKPLRVIFVFVGAHLEYDLIKFNQICSFSMPYKQLFTTSHSRFPRFIIAHFKPFPEAYRQYCLECDMVDGTTAHTRKKNGLKYEGNRFSRFYR